MDDTSHPGHVRPDAEAAGVALPYGRPLTEMTHEWLCAEVRLLHLQRATLQRKVDEVAGDAARWRALARGLAAIIRGLPRRPVIRKAWAQAVPCLEWAERAQPYSDLPGWAPAPKWITKEPRS